MSVAIVQLTLKSDFLRKKYIKNLDKCESNSIHYYAEQYINYFQDFFISPGLE